MTDVREVRRALLAVYDKTGVVELAGALAEMGVTLVSSGGTAATLREAGLEVTPVEEVTGFPEMLDGRVKTLHPRIHGGLLADTRKPEHLAQLAEHGIEPFDLVVVNLYPFRETVASGAGDDEVIEKIDIGGPAMVRAAAKNFESVGVVVDPSGYPEVLKELRAHGGLSRATRERLASVAFAHTAAYDAAVAGWFAERAATDGMPGFVGLALEKVDDLRYGENPHQGGALYRDAGSASPRTARGRACPAGQGHVVQQLARRGRGVLARGRPPAERLRDREAQQPVRRGGRRPAGRGVPARVRVRHASLPSAGSSRSTRRAPGPPRRRCGTCSPRS